MHGLGNILQNAMQFATTAVRVETSDRCASDRDDVSDDGPGFSPGLLGRLGEPYLSQRGEEHEHLGLGIFIAQTLAGTDRGRSLLRERHGGALCRARPL
jgi:two-component system sensor histidine kinase RegB